MFFFLIQHFEFKSIFDNGIVRKERQCKMSDRINENKVFAAVGGIVFKENCVLLVKRKNPPSQGKWSIPGGVIEFGESMNDAVRRELLEETGLNVTPLCIVEVIEKINRGKNNEILFHYIITDYLCLMNCGQLKASTDALNADFFHIDALAEKGIDVKTIEIVRKAKGMDKNG